MSKVAKPIPRNDAIDLFLCKISSCDEKLANVEGFLSLDSILANGGAPTVTKDDVVTYGFEPAYKYNKPSSPVKDSLRIKRLLDELSDDFLELVLNRFTTQENMVFFVAGELVYSLSFEDLKKKATDFGIEIIDLHNYQDGFFSVDVEDECHLTFKSKFNYGLNEYPRFDSYESCYFFYLREISGKKCYENLESLGKV